MHWGDIVFKRVVLIKCSGFGTLDNSFESLQKQTASSKLRVFSLVGDANAKNFTAENNNLDNKKSHDCEDERGLLDQHGSKIERSGGKEKVLTSTESVTDIRHRLGSIGKSGILHFILLTIHVLERQGMHEV